jgi:hypothetical protein
MYCQRHRSINYRFVSVMFWAFPYLLWQTFGHISGLFVGVLLAVILTAMFNNLFRRSNWNSTSSSYQQPLQMVEPQPHFQEMAEQISQEEALRPYQDGYQAEMNPYHEEQNPYQTGQFQPQYEEMQVPYPQEMPPIEQQ